MQILFINKKNEKVLFDFNIDGKNKQREFQQRY